MIIGYQPQLPPAGRVAVNLNGLPALPFFDSWAWRNRRLVAGGAFAALGLAIFGLSAVFNHGGLGNAGGKITAVSNHRYRATADEKRRYGGSTVTEFYVTQDGVTRKVIGYGKTPGERKTHAMRLFAEGRGEK